MKVVMVANALGIGGTEKGLESFATRLRGIDVSVVSAGGDGPRRASLEAAGIPVACAHGDEGRLAGLLRGADVVHVFRAGHAEPLVPAALRRAGVRHAIESNIFGNVDRTDDRAAFAAHLFGSKMTLLRYRDRFGGPLPDFHARHRVLSFPIEHAALRAAAPSREAACERLGLDPSRPVVGRVGRADDLKWRDLLVDMVPPLLELVPDAQVLFVGATPRKRRRLERLGVLDRVNLQEPTLDPERLSAFYAACDVFASAAEIGESQGMAIAEALALEIPVITTSTPWADNAQVEFVEHGRTGWFAAHPRSFAEAVASLLADEERRRSFGAAGRAFVEAELDGDVLAARLETLLRSLTETGEPPPEWEPTARAVEAYAKEYPRRVEHEFRPLTPVERAQVRATRERERARRYAGAVRPMVAARVPAFLRSDEDPAGRAIQGSTAGGRAASQFGSVDDAGYYTAPRDDVVSQLPRPIGRVLDVGCGAGGVGRTLRAAGAERLVGIEVHAPSAERAREIYDVVHVGTAEEVAADIDEQFDTICLYDVLEHTVDPLAVLQAVSRHAAPGARVHVSLPNARHFSLLYDLIFRGTFGYTEWGHRDATHLRWLTRRDLVELVERAGWRVVKAEPSLLGRTKIADRLTFGRAREFLALQWQVLGER